MRDYQIVDHGGLLLKQIENGGGKLCVNGKIGPHLNGHLEEIVLFPDTAHNAGNDEHRNIDGLHMKIAVQTSLSRKVRGGVAKALDGVDIVLA